MHLAQEISLHQLGGGVYLTSFVNLFRYIAQFQIKTAAESEHQGRVFYFGVESNKDAVDWVESVRRHSGQVSKRSSKGSATPIMAGMEVRTGRGRGRGDKLSGKTS